MKKYSFYEIAKPQKFGGKCLYKWFDDLKVLQMITNRKLMLNETRYRP